MRPLKHFYWHSFIVQKNFKPPGTPRLHSNENADRPLDASTFFFFWRNHTYIISPYCFQLAFDQ